MSSLLLLVPSSILKMLTGSTVLLYGPPGTGKTLTAQYLANELKLPLLKIRGGKVRGNRNLNQHDVTMLVDL